MEPQTSFTPLQVKTSFPGGHVKLLENSHLIKYISFQLYTGSICDFYVFSPPAMCEGVRQEMTSVDPEGQHSITIHFLQIQLLN